MITFNAFQKEAYAMRLCSVATVIGFELSKEKATQLVLYLELLAKWNKTYNLTAIRDPDEMLERHLVDSLSIVPFITAETLLDVGTGPGLPGIPLAIIYPEKQFTLLDSNSKKTRFITQSLITLGLKNVDVRHNRIEALDKNEKYHQIISRAFTALPNFVELCKQALTDNGQLLAMKGLKPDEKEAQLDSAYSITSMIELCVPGCDAQRHLIIIEPQ
jgi:16S rRNA (guanine527-N7)-methyltransferase